MSTPSDDVTFDAPPPSKPKKKAAKKSARKTTAPKQNRPEVLFPGLTKIACADGCNAKGCVISGPGRICAHPTKGGLQAAYVNDPAAMKRLQQARDQLAVRVDPDRFT